MTETVNKTFDAPVKRPINKKKITVIGAVAVGVAVLALVVNDKLVKRNQDDEPTETVES